MNCRSSGLLTAKALHGFLQAKTAEGLSPNTLVGYECILNLWLKHAGDRDVAHFTSQDLRNHLAWFRSGYTPHRFNGNTAPLSAKSLRNIWVILSAFFAWASGEFNFPNPMKGIPAPKFEEAPVEPFSKEEIERLLKEAVFCREAQTDQRKKFAMKRMTGKRDKAIIFALLDTGLRASELCALTIGDLDQKTGKITVKHGTTGAAKGGKGRTVYLGKTARSVLWRYLVDRSDAADPHAPVFLGKYNRPLNQTALRHVIHSLGAKANVPNCHPHRFRHTFAITYLRSGGDVFTLQRLLGHSTLDMVQHYTRIADVDVEQAHRRASPADNWHL